MLSATTLHRDNVFVAFDCTWPHASICPEDLEPESIVNISKYHLAWSRAWKTKVPAACFAIQRDGDTRLNKGHIAWLCPTTCSFTGTLAQLECARSGVLELQRPVRFQSSAVILRGLGARRERVVI